MNFLAHIYLSGDDDGVIIGNFIADGIKGSKYKNFPDSIQKGILLHRGIDTFTDRHPIVRQSTARLHTKYSHYSGIIVDIMQEHNGAPVRAMQAAQPLAVTLLHGDDRLGVLNATAYRDEGAQHVLQQCLPKQPNYPDCDRRTDGIRFRAAAARGHLVADLPR